MTEMLSEGVPGHVDISRRAIERVLVAITADELHVAPERVRVKLIERGRYLDVHVESPVHAQSLQGQSVLALCSTAKSAIIRRALDITGAAVSKMSIRVTGFSTANTTRRVA